MDGYPPDYEVEGQMSLFDDSEKKPEEKKDKGLGHYVVFVQDDAFDYPPVVKTKKRG